MRRSKLDPYREWLDKTHHQASQDFDKAVMTLASGALGISIAFADKIASKPIRSATWLAGAWVMLAVSLLAILFSFVSSQAALRSAARQYGAGEHTGLGGVPAKLTSLLNFTAAALLGLGVAALVAFAWFNVRR